VPQLVYFRSQYIALLKELPGIHSRTNAAGGAGKHQFAWLKPHCLAELGYLLPHIEYQVAGVRILPFFPVDEAANSELVWIPPVVEYLDA
jgi:hypothetical protein